MPVFVVASFNIHGGVDGWGRPHDVVAACRQLDADVLVLQEDWRPDGEQGVAARVAAELGYAMATATVSRTRVVQREPHGRRARRWGPRPIPGRFRAMRSRWSDPATRAEPAGPGSGPPDPPGARWGDLRVTMLSRLPVVDVSIVDLGRLPRDTARRAAVSARLSVGDTHVTVVGTHLSHLTDGSPIQFRRLRRALPPLEEPVVLVGDMNLWGPPLLALFPGWRRAVRGRTWLAWRRMAQLDHVLVTPAVSVETGEVISVGGSDHLPVRARVRVGATDHEPESGERA